MDPGEPAPPLPTRPDGPTLVALCGCVALLLVALVRAATLGTDYYDAYECRLAGQRLVGVQAWWPYPLYRSPLFVLACAMGEAVGPGTGWVAPLLLSVGGYGALMAGAGFLARRAGAPAHAAALIALLVGLDRLAFLYAPHGLPDVAAAGACALALAFAPGPEASWRARGGAGLLVGVAALCRPNAGLVGLALAVPAVGAARSGAWLPRALFPALVGAALYGLVATGLFAWAKGGLLEGLGAHAELARFQEAQLAQNRVNLGVHASWAAPLRALAVASPALTLLALGAFGRGRLEPAGRGAAAWLALHLLFLLLVAGHFEARYGLPALPALAGLAGVGLARLVGAAPRLAPALFLLPLGALALGGPYEARRLLDPVQRESFPARVAEVAAREVGPDGRFLYTTVHPYGVAPRVLFDPGTPYPGDPWHGIFHLGPVVLGYHLRRPVTLLLDQGTGLRDPGELLAFVRSQAGFREGDVLLVGEPRPCHTWSLATAPPGPFGVARVRQGSGGLELQWRWLTPGEAQR